MTAAVPIKERLLDRLMAVLWSIGPEAAAIEARNATGATVAVAGTYSGAGPQLYRLYVVTAGASGAAEIEIKELLTETVIQAGLAITSGSPFDLSDDLTATLTWTGTLLEGDGWFVRSGPGSANPPNDYQTTLFHVSREPAPLEMLPGLPAAVIYETNELLEPTHDTQEKTLFITLDLWVRGESKTIDMQRWEDRVQTLNGLLMDVEMALKIDPQFNGLAMDTLLTSIELMLPPDGTDRAGAQLSIEIHYATDFFDPATAA